jgi:Ca2+-binding EF-hand superfamily protein
MDGAEPTRFAPFIKLLRQEQYETKEEKRQEFAFGVFDLDHRPECYRYES